MAKDLLSRRKQEEANLIAQIDRLKQEDELSKIATNVGNLRAGLIPQLQAKTPVDITRGVAQRSPELDRRAQAQIDRIRAQRARQRYNLIFNNAFDQAVQAGLDQKSAENYARRLAEQEREFAFTASEAEKERESARRLNALANQFAQKGVALEQEFTPQFDYQSALLRALIGTGTALGTGYYLRNRRFPKESVQRQIFSPVSSEFGGEERV